MNDINQNDPAIILIFGITGDLSQRYLMPALYQLIANNQLNEKTRIVGISRRDVTLDQLFEQVETSLTSGGATVDIEALGTMKQRSRMLQMDLDDIQAYKDLGGLLNEIENESDACLNRLFYLSIPPQVYGGIIKLIGEANLNKTCQHGSASTRILVEKPFGYDLVSAQQLLDDTNKVFDEEQIFRIDHFLAKKGVQDFLAFRFANPDLTDIWNADNISSIEISASEQIGIEGRAKFYEPLGAMRDFIQNHLIQIMALTTMDLPETLDSQHVHSSREAVLKSVEAIPEDRVASRSKRGQYEGYKNEVNNDHSNTETYASIEILIDSPKWRTVPITIWTGKALSYKKYEIVVNFKLVEGGIFPLRVEIQPDERISINGEDPTGEIPARLEAAITQFGEHPLLSNKAYPNAYEKVILDALAGNRVLFASGAEVINSWRIIQPVLTRWQSDGNDLIIYPKGQTGPL